MRKRLQPLKKVGLFLVGGALGVVVFLAGLYVTFWGRIFPGVSVGGVYIGEMSREQAKQTLEGKISSYEVRLKYGESVWKIPSERLGVDLEATVEKAYKVGRDWEETEAALNSIGGNANVPVVYESSLQGAGEVIEEISSYVSIEPVPPLLEVEGGKVVLSEGQDGIVVDETRLRELLRSQIAGLKDGEITVPISRTQNSLSEEAKGVIMERANKLLTTKLPVSFEEQKFVLQGAELVKFLAVEESRIFDEESINRYVESVAESVNRPPTNAKFQFEGGRVLEFVPDKPGLKVVVEESAKNIKDGINMILEGQELTSVTLAVVSTPAQVKTADVNSLGVEELIGQGVSYFRGSIASRIHNLSLTADRLNGVLIPPGEEFSFNNAVGEISAATGYQSAYIIQNGRTVLGDGGGVCQDSTTLFRAVMDAGLPITERWAHSYRVGYYEQNAKPGLDATVFSPSKDFKFINDTGSNILINASVDKASYKLVINLYGKSDGRKSYVSQVRVWDVTPPPPALYQDDPTLTAGAVKQVDWKAWGAKASFDYRVEKNGETVFSKTYYSAYRPWQDVFLRGTKTE